MYKINKNDKAFKELADYANSVNQPLKDVLLSDAHLGPVTEIFYPNLPKAVRIVMNKSKFKDFYQKHREQLVGSILV